ncbi:unnamed protein product [Gemmataceae bacterium]|nr:unnamed protein product [Gemmataceae bacterium]VTU00539.1 unnamed protein product [Gemmataceae bacterium]
MSIQIADEKLVAAFAQSKQPVEIRDPSGRILGTLTPRPVEPEISEEELRIIEGDRTHGKWHTAAEVEAKLKELRQRLS